MSDEQIIDNSIKHISDGDLEAAFNLIGGVNGLPEHLQHTLNSLLARYRRLQINEWRRTIAYNDSEKTWSELSITLLKTLTSIRQQLNFSLINNTRSIGNTLRKGFWGRDHLLKQIEDCYMTGKNIAVLNGMDGMGKTQLAIEYAFLSEAMGKHREFIWWVRSESILLIQRDLVELCEKLDLNVQGQAVHEILSKLMRWLEKHYDWLLIFDNVMDEEFLKGFIPNGNGGHILITTPNQNWTKAYLNPVFLEVGKLDMSAVINLLIDKSADKLKSEEAHELALALDGYPVIEIEITGTYFSNPIHNFQGLTSVSFAAFLRQPIANNQKRQQLLNKISQSIDFGSNKSLVAQIGFGHALMLLSWISPRKIPKDLPRQIIHYWLKAPDIQQFWSKAIGRWVQQKMNNSRQAIEIHQNETLHTLVRFSFLREQDDQYFNLNPIVSDFFASFFVQPKKFLFQFFLENLADFLSHQLYLPDSMEEKLEVGRTYFPHAATFLQNVQKGGYIVKGTIKLCRCIYDYLLVEGYYAAALEYVQLEMDIEKKIKGKISTPTFDRYADALLIIGDFNLLDEFLRTQPEAEGAKLAADYFKKGNNMLIKGKTDSAYKFFEKATQVASSLPKTNDAFPVYYLYTAVAQYASDNEKYAEYLEKADTLHKQISNGKPEDEIGYLIAKGGAFLSIADSLGVNSPKGKSLFSEAYRHLKDGQIMLAKKIGSHHPLFLIIANIMSDYSLGVEDLKEAQFCADQYNKYADLWESSHGKKSYNVAIMKLKMVQLAIMLRTEIDAKGLLTTSHQILNNCFPNMPEQPDLCSVREMMEKVINLTALEVKEEAKWDEVNRAIIILLINNGGVNFAYIALRADRLDAYMEAKKNGVFYPEDYGVIIESDVGVPSKEIRKKMEDEYGFNHQDISWRTR